jgi:hypothetical protein
VQRLDDLAAAEPVFFMQNPELPCTIPVQLGVS